MSDGECHISKKGDCECQHNLNEWNTFSIVYMKEKKQMCSNFEACYALLTWLCDIFTWKTSLMHCWQLWGCKPDVQNMFIWTTNKQKKWLKTKNFQMLLIATNLPICECIEPSTIGTPICTADSCEAATDFANLIFEDQMLLSWKRKETVIFKDWRWNENILSVDL